MKSYKKEITIGICVIAALGVIIFGINYLKGINIFKTSNYYYASYTNAAGLQLSAPVMLNGFKVGQVRDIVYEYDNPGHLRVELSLDKHLKLPEGSKAIIEQDLLGTASVTLEMGNSTNYHKVGDNLIGETSLGLLESVSNSLMPNINAIFPKIDSLLTSLNNIVADPALSQSIKRIDAITLNLEQTMAQINVASKSLPNVINNVNNISSDFKSVSSDLASVSGKLNSMPIDSTMQNIYVISENLKALSAELDNPNSSLGMLLHDKGLYDNLNNCAASLDSLLIDVKRNPKRYISIKLL